MRRFLHAYFEPPGRFGASGSGGEELRLVQFKTAKEY